MNKDAAYWESQYNNRAAVADFQDYLDRWAEHSAAARATLRCRLDVPYGPHPMETMDLFMPAGASRACLMFIHGGYWRALDKKDHSFVAAEFVARGVTVAVPNYALCPSVTVETIVLQILRACAWLHRKGAELGAPAGALHVCGHSAGGHLTAMAMAAVFPAFAPDLPARLVQGGLAISGIYDMSEIPNVPSVNGDVRLAPEETAKLSPLAYPPATDARLYLAAGGRELPPFLAQQRRIAARWKRAAPVEILCPDDHHFSILDRLTEPSSALFRGALEMMKL